MTPPECGAPLTIEGGTVIRCTALPGHPDTHTGYYRDRLHEWADVSVPADTHRP